MKINKYFASVFKYFVSVFNFFIVIFLLLIIENGIVSSMKTQVEKRR